MVSEASEREEVNRRERLGRLERAGFVLHHVAVELRNVRERYPSRDELANRLYALEEEARTLAGLIAMEWRDLEHPGEGLR